MQLKLPDVVFVNVLFKKIFLKKYFFNLNPLVGIDFHPLIDNFKANQFVIRRELQKMATFWKIKKYLLNNLKFTFLLNLLQVTPFTSLYIPLHFGFNFERISSHKTENFWYFVDLKII